MTSPKSSLTLRCTLHTYMHVKVNVCPVFREDRSLCLYPGLVQLGHTVVLFLVCLKSLHTGRHGGCTNEHCSQQCIQSFCPIFASMSFDSSVAVICIICISICISLMAKNAEDFCVFIGHFCLFP